MKKVKDPGLIYMQTLEINPAKNYGQVFDQLTRRHGKDQMEALMKFMTQNPDNDNYIDFYDGFFANPELGFSFSTLCMGDYYRKVCNLIHEKKDHFSGRILEIGCGNGVLTGYLALTFPDAQITAIDSSKNALEATRRTLERLGADHVTLLHTSIEDYNEPAVYDTIFESLAISESCGIRQEDDNLSIEEKAQKRAPGFAAYIDSVSRHLSDGGSFIMMEPALKGSYYPGLFRSLLNHGLSMDAGTFSVISAIETGQADNHYLFAVNRKENKDTFWPALTAAFKLLKV